MIIIAIEGLIKEKNMAIRTRQQQLIAHVDNAGIASVEELSRVFNVSQITIRRDIDYLDKSEFLCKVKGGAKRLTEFSKFHEGQLQARMKINISKKQALAQEAHKFIEAGDSLFMDGSTTIICLARIIARYSQPLTVLTNSLLVGLELAQAKNIRLITVGGLFDPETFSCFPVDNADSFPGFHVKKAFLSCTGLIAEQGTYENSVFNLALKKMIVQSTARIFLLVDRSKIGQYALNKVIDIDSINTVITEKSVPGNTIRTLRSKGVEVSLVETEG